MDFSDFKPFNLQEGVPYLSITRNGVTFNKSVILKLNYPEYAIFLIDKTHKRVAIRACPSGTPNAARFYNRSRKGTALSVRWNSRDLLNTLCQMTGWDLNKTGYRIPGTFYNEEQAVLFSLDDAIILN